MIERLSTNRAGHTAPRVLEYDHSTGIVAASLGPGCVVADLSVRPSSTRATVAVVVPWRLLVIERSIARVHMAHESARALACITQSLNRSSLPAHGRVRVLPAAPLIAQLARLRDQVRTEQLHQCHDGHAAQAAHCDEECQRRLQLQQRAGERVAGHELQHEQHEDRAEEPDREG